MTTLKLNDAAQPEVKQPEVVKAPTAKVNAAAPAPKL